MKPFDFWTQEDNDAFLREGLYLTNDPDGRVEIAKLDDPSSLPGLGFDEPKFQSDDEAVMHCMDRARQGSALHLKALLLQGHPISEHTRFETAEWRHLSKEPRHAG